MSASRFPRLTRARHRLYCAPLGTRLLLASLVLVVVLLPLAGFGLTYNFRESATASFDSRLESQLNALLAGIQIDGMGQHLRLNRSLGDARFERVYSGWYWQVTDEGDLTLTSRSLWDQRLPTPAPQNGVSVFAITGPRDEPLRMIERDIRVPGHPEVIRVALAGSTRELDREVGRFERLLIISLATFAVLLLAGLALQMRWGLAPLRRMSANLRAVEEGEAERLDTQLPAELEELALAMNSVLERDRRLIERGRAAAGNLAHALKTPVSVLKTLAERFPPSSASRSIPSSRGSTTPCATIWRAPPLPAGWPSPGGSPSPRRSRRWSRDCRVSPSAAGSASRPRSTLPRRRASTRRTSRSWSVTCSRTRCAGPRRG
ncbi:sensor histidine kinase N-terminal domain-containing protein [Salinicola sp. JS01]|uniref:sensor histidine kinase N-terminal domain-containing protein n=1 Tax=Salinicola sp. JS01 TaxID=3050071 RepID=UPI003342374D